MKHSDSPIVALPERCWASLPADDPRYSELRTLLASIQRRGKHSPVARMLGEYALIGFLITTGKLTLAATTEQPALVSVQQQLSEIQSVQEHVSGALAGLDFE
jgi:hypothetical protein